MVKKSLFANNDGVLLPLVFNELTYGVVKVLNWDFKLIFSFHSGASQSFAIGRICD